MSDTYAIFEVTDIGPAPSVQVAPKDVPETTVNDKLVRNIPPCKITHIANFE